ncbi:MAG: hypothetical protein KC457_21750, partial [Myxococcales bacterium]|nr:hypothetical protein [Myxococcales bacterium]
MRSLPSQPTLLACGGAPLPSHPLQDDEQPEVLAERYRVDALLGTGGMGAVYRVFDRRCGEPLALKLLYCNAAERRSVREHALARRVTHPNVVHVRELGHHRGRCFLTMELLDGENLCALLQREGR